jgi:hypothetical protein
MKPGHAGSGRACGAARIGLVSDTHGLARPALIEFLRGCSHIVHAGDVGAWTVRVFDLETASALMVLGSTSAPIGDTTDRSAATAPHRCATAGLTIIR